MTAITLVAVGVALMLFVALAFGPSRRERQTPIFKFPEPALPTLPGPTFVTQPAPDWRLRLSPDVAEVTYRITNSGFTGLIPDDSLMTTYRLVASSDVLTVAWLYPDEVLPFPSPATGDVPLRVRGRHANWIVTDNGVSAIRWLEEEMVFEMASRTLTVAELTDLANKLR